MIWQALAWKEWHEHKWKLAAATAIVVSVSSMPLYDYDRMSFGAATFLAVFCILPLAMFIGAGVATGERSRGTLEFTRALPVPQWKVAAHKLAAGALTCIVPIIVNILLVLALYAALKYALNKSDAVLTLPGLGSNNRLDLHEWLVESLILATLSALSIFVWTAALGVRAKDEVSACARALLGIFLWWTILIGAMMLWRWRGVIPLAYAASPGGWFAYASVAERENLQIGLGMAAAVAMLLLLAVVYLVRFQSSPSALVRSQKSAEVDCLQVAWLAPPFASRPLATIWKQYRESRPIVLTGLAGIGLLSLAVSAANWQQMNLQNVGTIVAGVSLYFGFLVTLVVAVGLFLHDLQPQLHTFWRSRPVPPDQYFWLKFVTGIAVLAATFAVPFLCAAATNGISHPDFRAIGPWAVLVPIWLYCAAVMMTCLVRHAIYAAILSGAVMYLNFLLIVGGTRAWLLATRQISWEKWSDPSSAEVAASMIIGSIAFAIIAWLCVRNDWGAKSRY
ncbi:MAG: ABC transporter permease subunit [Pirellulales bacterium]